MTNTYCYVFIVETPDDGYYICPETFRVVYENKLEEWCILLAFIRRIFHDARSCECQTLRIYSLGNVISEM
jgi:hypothetical protein